MRIAPTLALMTLSAFPLFGQEMQVCTGIIVPGVVVEVRDSITGVPRADGARGIIRDGAYADSLRPAGWSASGALLSLQGAHERAGTYEVSIERPPYATWRVAGVLVRGGYCHVVTVHLTARLQPTKQVVRPN